MLFLLQTSQVSITCLLQSSLNDSFSLLIQVRLYHRYKRYRSFRVLQPLHCNWLWNLVTNQFVCSNRWPSPAFIINLSNNTKIYSRNLLVSPYEQFLHSKPLQIWSLLQVSHINWNCWWKLGIMHIAHSTIRPPLDCIKRTLCCNDKENNFMLCSFFCFNLTSTLN